MIRKFLKSIFTSSKKAIITEEMNLQKEWYKEAEKQTLKTLPAFLKNLTEGYNHDYGTICHAVASAGIAAMHSVNHSKQGGITGFQAGIIMWKLVKNWQYPNNKVGLKITDYDNLLYPQYEDKFNKVLSKNIWESLQKEAKARIKEDNACDKVLDHWKSIVDGNVPFGFVVLDD